jgi:hypothetical protein
MPHPIKLDSSRRTLARRGTRAAEINAGNRVAQYPVFLACAGAVFASHTTCGGAERVRTFSQLYGENDERLHLELRRNESAGVGEDCSGARSLDVIRG